MNYSNLLQCAGGGEAFPTRKQNEGDSETLPWNTRMKIALGAAEGLKFLQSQDAQIILHYFNTTNVLLDAVVWSLPYFCPL